jgi:hypothetical protein
VPGVPVDSNRYERVYPALARRDAATARSRSNPVHKEHSEKHENRFCAVCIQDPPVAPGRNNTRFQGARATFSPHICSGTGIGVSVLKDWHALCVSLRRSPSCITRFSGIVNVRSRHMVLSGHARGRILLRVSRPSRSNPQPVRVVEPLAIIVCTSP